MTKIKVRITALEVCKEIKAGLLHLRYVDKNKGRVTALEVC